MGTNGLQRLRLVALVAKYISSYTFNFLLLVTKRVQLEESLLQHVQKCEHSHIWRARPFLEPVRSKKARLTHFLVHRRCSFHSAPPKPMFVEPSANPADAILSQTHTNASSSQFSTKDASMSHIQNSSGLASEKMGVVSQKRKK